MKDENPRTGSRVLGAVTDAPAPPLAAPLRLPVARSHFWRHRAYRSARGTLDAGNDPMGRAFFTVIAAIAQLERELIVERVKNGLKNAKMKGKQIGRKKTRPSEMIRALLKKGLSLRTVAGVTGSSHGSVSLEKKLMKQEEAEARRKMTLEPLVLPSPDGITIEVLPPTTESRLGSSS